MYRLIMFLFFDYSIFSSSYGQSMINSTTHQASYTILKTTVQIESRVINLSWYLLCTSWIQTRNENQNFSSVWCRNQDTGLRFRKPSWCRPELEKLILSQFSLPHRLVQWKTRKGSPWLCCPELPYKKYNKIKLISQFRKFFNLVWKLIYFTMSTGPILIRQLS